MPKRLTCSCLAVAGLALATLAAPAAGEPPVPPPIIQLRADCTRPQYASDGLVCGDAELAALDSEVAALTASPPRLAAGAIWEDQSDWFRRRSLCAFQPDHRACLLAAYTDRRSVLAAATAPGTVPIRCTGAWQGRTLAASVAAPGEPLAIRAEGLLVGVATPARAGWRPVLGLHAAGPVVRLMPRDSRAFSCRPGSR